MPVLRDDGRRIESRGRAQNRPDIVRIGHLIEHHDRARGIFIEHIVEENVFQRLAFQHQTLMRRVLGHQAAQIDRLAVIDVEALGQFAIEAGDALARGPELAMHAIRVLERGLDRMAAPQADGALVAAPAAASALHATRAAAHGPTAFIGLALLAVLVIVAMSGHRMILFQKFFRPCQDWC
jgi:hypothetical protein